ncbi:MAG: chromosome partitioning protein ParB, partial [Thermodesulfobacteriota bacterium]
LEPLYNRIIKNEESVRAVEAMVAKLNEDHFKKKRKRTLPPKRKSPEIQKIEDDLFHLLETKVSVHQKGKKGGVIEIEYFDDEDLDRLLDLLFQIEP